MANSRTHELQSFDNDCWPSDRVAAPCQEACPVGTDVAGYIMSVVMGDYDEAYRIIAQKNPLPGVCGRICDHPCETQCVRAKLDQPVAIRALKRFAIEQASEKTVNHIPPMARKTGKRVAIVGSGPSGLSAAHDLAVLGHEVSVFEKSNQKGGLLALAIPPFILPRKILHADLRRIESLGIHLEIGSKIQGKRGIEHLFKDGYSAVLLAVGALKSLDLKGVDISSPMVETGLSFLMRMQGKSKNRIEGRVLIIGGGNVAIDAARVCVRQGAEEVNVFCIEKSDHMPAFEWEKKRALKEGVKISDGWGLVAMKEGPQSTLNVQFGRVREIKTTEDGRFQPVVDKDDRCDINAKHMILAVGQKIDSDVLKGLRISLTRKGTLATNTDFMVESYPGLFAAGDMVIYPGTVTGAMGVGKKAAEAIDRFLEGKREKISCDGSPSIERTAHIDGGLLSLFPKRIRQKMPELSINIASNPLKEVETGFSTSSALKEASRCLNCAMCSNCIMDRRQICRGTALRLLT